MVQGESNLIRVPLALQSAGQLAALNFPNALSVRYSMQRLQDPVTREDQKQDFHEKEAPGDDVERVQRLRTLSNALKSVMAASLTCRNTRSFVKSLHQQVLHVELSAFPLCCLLRCSRALTTRDTWLIRGGPSACKAVNLHAAEGRKTSATQF